jgi:hypothetical protein
MIAFKSRIVAGMAILFVAAATLSACGKQGELQVAPPLLSDSTSDDPLNGAKRRTERALPDADGPNNMPDPYRQNVPVSQAPLEGFGNAQRY